MSDPTPAEGGDLFTRGGPNMPDNRGKSMVAVHLDKLQKEKEERGMEKLRLLMPQLSAATHAVALQECNWEEDKALAMLHLFVAKKADELKKLAKEKKKHQKMLIERMNKAQRSSDRSSGSDSSDDASSSGSSGSDSDSSGSSDSESREDRRSSRDRKRKDSSRKRKYHREDRHSKKKRSRKEKDSRKHKSSSRRREKERSRRKDKKEKREKKRSRHDRSDGPSSKRTTTEYEYGKFGVIRETDYYSKRAEFMLWALEVKKSDVESMSRFEEKELFKSYMEDYNTATLPHKKFYDLEAFEKETAAIRAGGGGGAGGSEKMFFDDEAERKKELLAQRQREHADRLRAAYEELQTTDKAQAMREQELLRAKMALAYRTGDQKEAARLAERLKPDEPK